MTPTRTVADVLRAGAMGLAPAAGTSDTMARLSLLIKTSCCVADGAQHSSGIAGHNGVRRDIARDHAAGADDRAFADRHVRKNGGARSDRRALLHNRLLHFPVGGGLELSVRRRRSRVRVVDEHHAVADEDVILDGDALADKGVTRNLAAPAN